MRILVAEDDRELAAIVGRGLRKHAFAVDLAHDGESAIFLAETNEYDLIVLDVMMPKKDGFEVCRDLRIHGCSTPVLMLTARDAVADRIEGLDLGADDYLTKPFDFGEFLARVRALLRRRGSVQPNVVEIGTLRVDTVRRAATRSGRPIALTAKEYGLVEFLARNAHRVVTRAELAEHVWDNDYDAFSNVIDVFIRRVRQKIDDGEDVRLIRTRRRMGYVLTDEPELADTAEGES